jgi:methionine synthase II (cobalamin-independent)
MHIFFLKKIIKATANMDNEVNELVTVFANCFCLRNRILTGDITRKEPLLSTKHFNP